MPRLAPKLLELEKVEKEELEKILARHSTSQQMVKRARIILLASEGKNHRQIARELDISRKMARLSFRTLPKYYRDTYPSSVRLQKVLSFPKSRTLIEKRIALFFYNNKNLNIKMAVTPSL